MFLFELSFLITAWLLSYIQLLERKLLVGSCRRISCRCVGVPLQDGTQRNPSLHAHKSCVQILPFQNPVFHIPSLPNFLYQTPALVAVLSIPGPAFPDAGGNLDHGGGQRGLLLSPQTGTCPDARQPWVAAASCRVQPRCAVCQLHLLLSSHNWTWLLSALLKKNPPGCPGTLWTVLHQIRFVVVVVAIYVWVGLCHQQSFQCIDDEWKKTLNQHKPPSNNQTLHGEIDMCISGA